MKRMLALVLAVLPVAAVAAGAAEPPESAKIAPSHARAATEVVRLMNIESGMAGGAAAMADTMVQQNPILGPYREVILEWAGSFMTWENFGPRFIEIYAEAFTEPELNEMAAFYRTATGRKAVALMPALMQKGAMLGSEVAQQHAGELERMIKERAAELEAKTQEP